MQLHAAAVEHVVILRGFLLKLAERGVYFINALLPLVHTAAYLAYAVLLIRDIVEHTLHTLLAALDVGAKHRGVRLTFGCRRLGGGQALARMLRLDVLLVHTLGYALGRGIQRLKLRPRLLQLGSGLLVLGLDIVRLRAKLVQRLHPDGYLLHAQFVAQFQIFFCGLGLLFQRPYLNLKLFYLVVHAEEIFLRFFELALRLLLAVAEAGYARRFLEDLAPVGALGGDDLRDAPLTDYRIAVAAKAGIHEEAVYILEPDRLAVDVILAVAAAVIAAGQHYLAAVIVEDVGRVINYQRHLRKAQRTALLRAAENDVLHFRAAQSLCPLLAHDPEYGVGYVRLAGAVRPDNGGYIFFKRKPRFIGEGFESLYLQCF